jgi:hypothetical protein
MLNKTILQLSANLPVLDACIHCRKSMYLQQDPIVYLIHEVLREERHRGRSALIWLSDSLELLILNNQKIYFNFF